MLGSSLRLQGETCQGVQVIFLQTGCEPASAGPILSLPRSLCLPLLTDGGMPSACLQAVGKVDCYMGENRRIRTTGLGLQPLEALLSPAGV